MFERWRTHVAAAQTAVDPVQWRTAPMPRVLWIELTSRCPFDCVFCSRKLLRGAGKHLDFALYERLIAGLEAPEIIRLNYSGESSHYPQLVEACRLAAATGADVELVTALAALPWHRVDALAHAGITRLTVSLHTLDAQRFRDIYRFSEVTEMRARIERVVELAATAPRRLDIDFAFVAMRRNLADLAAVADYAVQLGLQRLAVHPVIRRDPIEETFPQELDGDRLRPEFITDLSAAIDAVRAAHPQLVVSVSTPELESAHELDAEPRPYPPALPDGARIHTCDQDPWQTVHILADGAVVSCEERDRHVLGNLTTHSLREIWHSEPYRQFRNDYAAARDARCRRCPYKQARLAAAPPSRIASMQGRAALLDGWYEEAEPGLIWSRQQSRLQLAAGGDGRLRLHLLLPQGNGAANGLRLRLNGEDFGSWRHAGRGMQEIRIDRPVRSGDMLLLEFETAQAYVPQQHGEGADSRRLGFALISAAFEA